MQFGDTVGDRQAEPAAAFIASCGIHAFERPQQPAHLAGRYSRPVIHDADDDISGSDAGADRDFAFAIGEGVVDQIADQPVDRQWPQLNLVIGGEIQFHVPTGPCVAIGDGLDQGVDVDHLWWLAFDTAHEIQELVDDVVHVGYVLNHAVTRAFADFLRQHFNGKSQPRQRCAQIMRDTSQQQRSLTVQSRQGLRHFIKCALHFTHFFRPFFR